MTISWPKLLGAWLFVAAGAVGVRAAGFLVAGRSVTLAQLEVDVALLALWAGASPLVFRSARRFPVRVAAPIPNAAIHVVLGSLFVAASNVAIRLPLLWQPTVGMRGLVTDTAEGLATYYPGALVCYLALVAIGQRLAASAPAESRVEAAAPSTDVTDVTDVPDVTGVPEPAAPGSPCVPRLVIREWNRVHLIAPDDIEWIEASNNHVVVHTSAREYRGRERISDVEARLDERRFVRVHRSAIVHLDRIREVQPLARGDHAVILRSGRVVRVARSRRQALADALGMAL